MTKIICGKCSNDGGPHSIDFDQPLLKSVHRQQQWLFQANQCGGRSNYPNCPQNERSSTHLETSMSPLDYALHPHIPALQRAQNVTSHLYNTDYYITKLNRLNIICLLKHSLVSFTVVISVVSTFNIALVFLNLYAMLLFIVKSSLQCATEIIINLRSRGCIAEICQYIP